MKRRVMSLVLATLMALTLPGCASGASQPAESDQSAQESGTETVSNDDCYGCK